MFRAVADQLYGDAEMHANVRRLTLDYMARERDHFSQFVTEDFDAYLDRKRRLTVYGNHTEIQVRLRGNLFDTWKWWWHRVLD